MQNAPIDGEKNREHFTCVRDKLLSLGVLTMETNVSKNTNLDSGINGFVSKNAKHSFRIQIKKIEYFKRLN